MRSSAVIIPLLIVIGAAVIGGLYLSRNRLGYPLDSWLSNTVSWLNTGGSNFEEGNQPAATETPTPTVPVGQVLEIPLEITRPADGASVTQAKLMVGGVTALGADVLINDQEVTADSSGKFSTVITLDEGENTIVVTANDSNGNYAEKEITVTLTSA